MIFVLAAALGLVIAILRGVSLTKIAEVRFRGLIFVVAALALHILLNLSVMPPTFSARLIAPPAPGVPPLGNLLYMASLACALAFLFVNRRIPGFSLMLAGLGLNVLVIVVNGGQMPGDPAQLQRAGLLQDQLESMSRGLWSPFSLIEPSTLLSFLADVIYVPMPFRQPTIASVGDFIIALGVIGFFNPLPSLETVTRRD